MRFWDHAAVLVMILIYTQNHIIDAQAPPAQYNIGDSCVGEPGRCNGIANGGCTGGSCQCNAGYSGADGTSSCTADVTVRCMKSGTGMTFEIRATKDAVHQQIATYTNNDDLRTSKCKTDTVVTTGGGSFLELKITVDSARVQTVPDKTSSDCFVIKTSGTTTKATVLVVGQADPQYVQVSDKFYEAACDLSTANGDVIKLEDAQITSSITPTEKNPGSDNIEIELVRASDITDTISKTAVPFGEEVKLKVTFTREAVATAPLGLFLHSLIVSDAADLTDDSTQQLTMLNQHGCAQILPVFSATTFVPLDKTIEPATATKFEAATGAFQLALFEGSSTLNLFFTLSYEASCYSNQEDKCFDLAAYCLSQTQSGVTSRRRRSASDVKNSTATLKVRVTLNGDGYTANSDGSDIKNVKECKTALDFWIVAMVLGCLLLAILLFSVFLFYRVKREKRRSDKLEEISRAQNPVF